MGADRESFEIQVMKDGRWSTESVSYSEAEARQVANKFLGNRKCEGCKIVRNWLRSDGTMTETEIFSEVRNGRDDGPLHIAPIETAPPKCEKHEDYFGKDSRGVMNRLFRAYLDKQLLTPTELIYNFRELKRIQDKDNLVYSGVDRVAQLQTGKGEESKSRREEIQKAVDQMSARARRIDGMKLPKMAGRFSETIAKVREMAVDEDPDYLALAILARDLINVQSWIGKLERLCKLAMDDDDPHAIGLLDGVIADVLGSNVVQEILGWQPSLGAAICAMLDLAEGKLAIEGSEAGESVSILNALLVENKLPASRATMIDRAQRQLRSANPLNRSEQGKEQDEFKRILARVLLPTGFFGGADTVEALTTRYTRLIEQGGAAGRKIAIENCFRLMPDKAYGLMYICELVRTDYVTEHAADMAAMLNLLFTARRLGDLCSPKLTAKDRMIRATIAHGAVMGSTFPESIRRKLADFIDDILERYLIEEEIIEKLDNPEDALRDRAGRLVQFCAAGVLPEGKAMTLARKRVKDLLRQPNFDSHFVDGIEDPEKAQKALRDFHILLMKAGFK